MADEVLPFPFATLAELKARWPDFPTGADTFAGTLLEDASQYILDVAPSAAGVSAATRRRIACAVARRSMTAEGSEMIGFESIQQGAGPYQETRKATNPHGDFYLTGQEKKALGVGRQRAFTIDLLAGSQ